MTSSPPCSPDNFEVPVFDAGVDEDQRVLDDEAFTSFEDIGPIRGDVLPVESDSECEDDSRGIIVFEEGPVKALSVGQIYYDKAAIQRLVLDHGLFSGRNLKKYRHDTNKIGFKCLGGECEWKVYAAKINNSDKWEIRMFNSVHSCVPNGECALLKVTDIAKLFVDKIRDEPEYFMPRKIEAIIKERWKINASRTQCQAARNMALKWITKAYDKQFGRLRDYAAEIMEWNPNSTVEVETVTTSEGVDVFKRIYICYGAVKKSWKECCRQLIGMDGCFLRSKMKGQLLVALGRDGNNQIYPIAWCVVQKEDKENWQWFVKKVKVDLDLDDGGGYVIMSDGQKSLLKAVELELPMAEHRMCVRHIYANLKKRHGRKLDMKQLIWKLAWSYNMTDYRENLHQIELLDSAVYDSVLDSKPETWCRAFHQIGSCCEDVDNNSTESFNASIVKAREKPLVPMLEMIARLAMVRILRRSIKSLEHSGRLTPYAADILATQHPAASECSVHRSTNNQYMVQMGGCAYRVCLETMSCSCRKWDLRGIPCEHAYGVIISRKMVVEDFVLHWYRTQNWINTYAEGINPTRGARFWPILPGPVIQKPLSPAQPGRKKNMTKKQKRKKGVNESPTKRQPKLMKRTMHCGVCGEANHNSRYHKKERNSQSQGEPCGSQQVPEIPSQEL